MPARFKKVDDKIYRGGKPSRSDLQILSNIYDIKTIISLDGPIGDSISPIVKNLGMNHIIMPLGDSTTIDLIRNLKDNIVELLTINQPVYIHCKHGSDRTGMAIALYRIKNNGWPIDKAMREARGFGFGDKLDNKTENLYLNEIFDADDDAATQMRESFDSYPPAFNPQQSFAPYIPQREMSYYPAELRRKQLKDMRKDIFINMLSSDVPAVGKHDNCCEGIRGAGPVENQGFINL